MTSGFAGSFLRCFERRRRVLLGIQFIRPGDSFAVFCVVRGLCHRVAAGARIVFLTTCLSVQLGHGSKTDRSTPVAVAGLSSGVAMVALGNVRLVASAACLMLV